MSIDGLVVAFALLGSALGFVADVIAHRWPAHEDDYEPRRPVDWRTVTVIVAGATSFGALGSTYGHAAAALAVYVPLFAALLMLLATDLDQRLLPDLITLPLIVFAAAVLLTGNSPALQGKDFGVISGLAAAFFFPLLLIGLDRIIGGDLGFGDVKLAVSLGLMFGLTSMTYGMFVATIGFAVLLIALIAVKRITLRTAIPFGPVLVFAAFIAALWA